MCLSVIGWPTMANLYTMGQNVEMTVVFTDKDGNAVDPSVVTCMLRSPNGIVTQPAVQRVSQGNYLASYTIPGSRTSAGTWSYRFEGTGAGPTGAADAYFFVPPDPFYGG